MRIKKLKNLYQITFLSKIFPINCYIYEEEASLTLIDIGIPLFCKPVLKLSKTLNKQVDKIIITHPHQDHISGLDAIKKELPSAIVYLSQRDSFLLKKDFRIQDEEEKGEIKGGISVAGDKRWLFPFPALATWSMEEAIKSVRKLYELKISILATGHGNMIENPREKMQKAINRAQKRKNKK